MKKIFVIALALFAFSTSSTYAASFQTGEEQSLREFVDQLQDNRYQAISDSEREELSAQLLSHVDAAKSSFLVVRNTEISRLNQILASRSQSIRQQASQRRETALASINKSCARKKKGKTAKQQAAIEVSCKKRRQVVAESINNWLEKQLAAVQKSWGPNSVRRTFLEENYTKAVQNADRYATRGQTYIASMPSGVAPTLEGTIAAPSGIKKVGSTLIAQRGSWNALPDPVYNYQWQRCSENAISCLDIEGADSLTYTLQAEDAGQFIRVRIGASNGFLPDPEPVYSSLTTIILSAT